MSSYDLSKNFSYTTLENQVDPDARKVNPKQVIKEKVEAPDQKIQISNVLNNFNRK